MKPVENTPHLVLRAGMRTRLLVWLKIHVKGACNLLSSKPEARIQPQTPSGVEPIRIRSVLRLSEIFLAGLREATMDRLEGIQGVPPARPPASPEKRPGWYEGRRAPTSPSRRLCSAF